MTQLYIVYMVCMMNRPFLIMQELLMNLIIQIIQDVIIRNLNTLPYSVKLGLSLSRGRD